MLLATRTAKLDAGELYIHHCHVISYIFSKSAFNIFTIVALFCNKLERVNVFKFEQSEGISNYMCETCLSILSPEQECIARDVGHLK